MATIDLLGGLQFYVFLLSSLMEQELKSIDDGKFVQTVSLEYNSIKLKLDLIDTLNGPVLYFQGDFIIEDQKITCNQIYSRPEARETAIKNFLFSHAPKHSLVWQPGTKTNYYDSTVLQYVAIADEIAKVGSNCASGDDYRPGYFSKIMVMDDQIVLEQTNHYNSRSTTSKDDYHLRDLEFYIPLKTFEGQKSNRTGLDNHWVGGMRIYFSDRSSPNNERCGNAIKAKIDAEIDKFEQTH